MSDPMDARQEHNARTSSKWRRKSRMQLLHFPLCAQCEREGRITAAEVAHHLQGGVQHDRTRLHLLPLESMCRWHHDRLGNDDKTIKRVAIGPDGWPVA
jgi:hypothetical protein